MIDVNQTYDKRAAMIAALDRWAECLLDLAEADSQPGASLTISPVSSFESQRVEVNNPLAEGEVV